MTPIELISLSIGVVGLFGLAWYAYSSWIVATATKRQVEVLSYPTVSVFCQADQTPRQPFSKLRVFAVNTGQVHVYVRITLRVVLHIGSTDQAVVFPAPLPYNGSPWTLSVGQRFNGHFTFEDLQARALDEGDSLTLEGTVESRAYGSAEEYMPNPPVYYKWKGKDRGWVPDVPPRET